jgi:hypothetical protein
MIASRMSGMSVKKARRVPKRFFGNSLDTDDAGSQRGVGKGIDTEDERRTLQALVAPWGQGFHVGPPEEISSATTQTSRTS